MLIKKIVIQLVLLLALIPSVVYAEDVDRTIKVFIDGQQVQFLEQPFIENDVTMVQFRPIFEKLGLSIEWIPETQTVVGRKEDLVIKLYD